MFVGMDIVWQLKNRDVTAFSWLYDSYAPTLYGMILKLNPLSKDANAILELSFLNIWNKIESFDSKKESLLIWMVQITIQQCIDYSMLPNEFILQKIVHKPLLQ